jgi:hypothetical protein
MSTQRKADDIREATGCLHNVPRLVDSCSLQQRCSSSAQERCSNSSAVLIPTSEQCQFDACKH